MFYVIVVVLVIMALISIFGLLQTSPLFAPSGGKNVSVNVLGIDPVSITIFNDTPVFNLGVNPIEGGVRNVNFVVKVSDPYGVNDVDVSSVSANFTRVGEFVRDDLNCVDLLQDTVISKNFSCTIGMQYYDDNGLWTITATGNDLGNGTAQQSIKTFQYNLLQSIEVSGESVAFPSIVPGSLNILSNNDPTILNNTGNSDNFEITGYDLEGVSFGGIVGAGNFSISTANGGECLGIALQNGSATIPIILNRGNVTLGLSGGVTNLYYCITSVPANLFAQAYSTDVSGNAWQIAAVL